MILPLWCLLVYNRDTLLLYVSGLLSGGFGLLVNCILGSCVISNCVVLFVNFAKYELVHLLVFCIGVRVKHHLLLALRLKQIFDV